MGAASDIVRTPFEVKFHLLEPLYRARYEKYGDEVLRQTKMDEGLELREIFFDKPIRDALTRTARGFFGLPSMLLPTTCSAICNYSAPSAPGLVLHWLRNLVRLLSGHADCNRAGPDAHQRGRVVQCRHVLDEHGRCARHPRRGRIGNARHGR